MWEEVGMTRHEKGLKQAISDIRALKQDYWKNVNVGGGDKEVNKNLEFAGRVADFLELGELMAIDALSREESCGGHFRTEYQTEDGEALRNDDDFCHVSAWQYKGESAEPELHKESLEFENVKLTTRSYK
jgi:succinate dehydrogenase / fumarate reductase flavoprotein subunit